LLFPPAEMGVSWHPDGGLDSGQEHPRQAGTKQSAGMTNVSRLYKRSPIAEVPKSRPHEERICMAEGFTEKQGQYLAFIESYMVMYGKAPAEADIQRFFGVTPPTIHQMILKLEEKGLISRIPGQPRSIRLLIDAGQIPRLKRP